MREFRTVIIDDERLAREELKRMVEEYTEIQVIGEAQNGDEGIEKINELTPDLIFLDVSMPGMTGFEMLKKLDEIPHVIFVTAHHEHALDAFEVHAVDYITKPVDQARLSDALEHLQHKEEQDYESAEPKGNRKERTLTITDRVFIKDGEKCFFVKLADVRMMESDGNYVKIYFGNNRPLIRRSLNSLAARLDPEYFFRANRKFIVNLEWIHRVENWFNGGLQVELKGEKAEKIEISRRQAIRFKEMLSL